MHRRGLIDRYLAGDLSVAAEERLRAHLAGCVRCRAYFDEQIALLRALAGDATRPTPAEGVRMVRRALASAGLRLPPAGGPAPRPARRTSFQLRAVAVAAALCVLVGATVLWQRLRSAPQPGTPGPAPAVVAEAPRVAPSGPSASAPASAPAAEVVAGRLTRTQRTRIDGQPAAVGAVVRAGATLQVAAGGHAEIEVERGGRLRLYPHAEARLQGRGDEVDLEGGRVWCQVEAGHGGFSVRTDEAEARVLGTSFVVERQKGHTDVRVMSGAVDVEDRGKRGVVRVKARERTRVEARTAPGRVKRYAPEGDSGDWDRLLADIRRALKRTGKAIERGLKSLGDKLK